MERRESQSLSPTRTAVDGLFDNLLPLPTDQRRPLSRLLTFCCIWLIIFDEKLACRHRRCRRRHCCRHRRRRRRRRRRCRRRH